MHNTHAHTKEIKPLSAGSCCFREFSGSFAVTRESVAGRRLPQHRALSRQVKRSLKKCHWVRAKHLCNGKDGFLFLLRKTKLPFQRKLLVQSSSWAKCKGERAPTLWGLVSLPLSSPPPSHFISCLSFFLAQPEAGMREGVGWAGKLILRKENKLI